MKYIVIISFLGIIGCTSHLDIAPILQDLNQQEVKLLPDFNFNVRPTSGSDLIKSSESQIYSIYIRQLDFQVQYQTYYLMLQPTNGYDGNIEIIEKQKVKIYRIGDWIPIEYDSLLNQSVSIRYMPVKPSVGTYSINFICFDKTKRIKTVIRPLTVNP
jgi:uncharacterized protein YcfL